MEELGNILHNEDDLSEDQLKKYISGEGSAEEMHTVEKSMAGSEFINDAVEGLQSFSSEKKLDDFVAQINKNLTIHLQERKLKKNRRKIKDLSWSVIAVITILLLCILCYIVIRMLKEHEAEKTSVEMHVHHQISNTTDNNDFIL